MIILSAAKIALLFDLDNTLIEIKDTHNHFDSIIIEVLKKKGLPIPALEDRNQLWRNVDYKELLGSWGCQDPDDFWRLFDEIDFVKRKRRHDEKKIVLFDDVEDVLDELERNENVILGLISNTSPPIVNFELELFGLKQYFPYIIALGDNQEQCKPSEYGVRYLIDKIRQNETIADDEIYILGDSTTDIGAGINAGIQTVFINRRGKRKEQIQPEPDYILDSLSEIFEILGDKIGIDEK